MPQAFENHRLPFQSAIVAASAVLPKQPVKLAGTSALFVLPAATATDRPFGVSNSTYGASGLASNEVAAVFEAGNIVKAIAGASVGVGAAVAVGSSNGALTPAVIAASGHWEVGVSLTPAGAGEVFSLYIQPRKA